MTTRSGRMKSSMLEPSRRNSGLLAMSMSIGFFSDSPMIFFSLRAVPTGTVLLVTMTF